MIANTGLLEQLRATLRPYGAQLIAVSKTKSKEAILEVVATGQKAFGENYVQELLDKQALLPAEIEWHFIGHLQTNKVKYIAPFIHCIHSIDSQRLLVEIDKQAMKFGRIIPCLLQVHIAQEETKFGLSFDEARAILDDPKTTLLKHVRIIGCMGMASNTDSAEIVRKEFRELKSFLDAVSISHPDMVELSMGMSSDYKLALEEGSTMIRIGSSIFGERSYSPVP